MPILFMYENHIKNLRTSKIFLSSKRYEEFENQFVIFNLLSYCFEEIIGFDVNSSFASRPVSSNQMLLQTR